MALDRTFIESSMHVMPNIEKYQRFATVIGGYSFREEQQKIDEFLDNYCDEILEQTGVTFEFLTFNDLIKNKAAGLKSQQKMLFFKQLRVIYNETKEHHNYLPFF